MSTQPVTPEVNTVLNPPPIEAPPAETKKRATKKATPQTNVETGLDQRFPESVVTACRKPLPAAALSQAPRGMTSIKSIYITERLNEVFGLGRWEERSQIIERNGKDVVVRLELYLLDYPWFYGEAFGGNNNADLGDAYKGACTDALSKIAATKLEIGKDVYKGNGNQAAQKAEQEEKEAAKAAKVAQTEQNRATVANPPDCEDCKKKIESWVHPGNGKRYDAADLVANSQKKWKVNLCADCQAKRAAAVKAQAGPERIQ